MKADADTPADRKSHDLCRFPERIPGRLRAIEGSRPAGFRSPGFGTLAADLPVYFAFPPGGESGTNENTKSLIREYLQKGTEVPVDIGYLWAIADSPNDRPRTIPGFRKLSELCTGLMLAKPRSGSRLGSGLPRLHHRDAYFRQSASSQAALGVGC